jgi:hypothetical protein
LAQCPRFRLILQEYPDHKRHLLRLQQQRRQRKPRLGRG